MQENQGIDTIEKSEIEPSTQHQTKQQLFWEIIRFLIVGGTATLADYFVFWILDGVLFPLISTAHWWQVVSLILSTGAGFCVGLVVNWVLSVRFVFRAVTDKERATSRRSFMVFTVIGVLGLLLTEIGIFALIAIFPEINLFGSVAFLGTEWRKWIAKVIMTCIVLVFNYVGRKLFIFK